MCQAGQPSQVTDANKGRNKWLFIRTNLRKLGHHFHRAKVAESREFAAEQSKYHLVW